MRIFTHRMLTLMNDESLSSTNMTIGKTLLQNMHLLSELSIEEVAAMCHVSKSTLSKFVRKLGFEDYKDFRLCAEEEEQKAIYSYPNSMSIEDYIDQNGISQYIDILKKDMDLLIQNIDLKKIQDLVQDLRDYSKVGVFGSAHSQTVALDFQYKMAFNQKIVLTYLDDVKQDEFIKKAGPDTLIIIYSNSGSYLNEYQLISGWPKKESFFQTRARVVLITSNPAFEEDERVASCISFGYHTQVQNHPFLFRFINEMISTEYRKLVGIEERFSK